MIVVSNTHLTAAWKGFQSILYAVRSDLGKYSVNEVGWGLTRSDKS